MDARGLLGWILARWRARLRAEARLAVLERVTLAPRQSLALIEVEGHKLLVATAPDAAPTFYPLSMPNPLPTSCPLEDRASLRAHAGSASC